MARREDFNNASDWLDYLCHHEDALGETYENDPNILTERDENGQTILHHAARLAINLICLAVFDELEILKSQFVTSS